MKVLLQLNPLGMLLVSRREVILHFMYLAIHFICIVYLTMYILATGLLNLSVVDVVLSMLFKFYLRVCAWDGVQCILSCPYCLGLNIKSPAFFCRVV